MLAHWFHLLVVDTVFNFKKLIEEHCKDIFCWSCRKHPICKNKISLNPQNTDSFSWVFTVVCRVTQVLTAKLGDFIKFLSTCAEQEEIKQGLFQVGGFPSAIGCIDDIHIRITAPQENEPDFVNWKGFYSTDVQTICNLWGKLISLPLIIGLA